MADFVACLVELSNEDDAECTRLHVQQLVGATGEPGRIAQDNQLHFKGLSRSGRRMRCVLACDGILHAPGFRSVQFEAVVGAVRDQPFSDRADQAGSQDDFAVLVDKGW